VHLHGCDLAVQLGSPRVYLSEPSVTFLGDLGEPLGALLCDLGKTLSALLLHFIQYTTDLGQHTLLAVSSRGRISRRIASRVASVDCILT
jgi:hypothetical protein